MPALIAAYRDAEATILSSFSAIVAAENRLNDTFQIGSVESSRMRIDASRGHYRSSFDQPDQAIDLLKRQTWRALVERLEMRRMCSVERWKEIQEALDKGDLPAITEESVAGWAQGYLDQLPKMLEESVREAFEFLRPHRDDLKRLKTNSEMEIPPKVIVPWVGRHGCWSITPFEISHYYEQHALAVERVFQALDGRGSIATSYWSELHGAVKAAGKDGRGETTWFRFRACKNGNLHLEFKRIDLLRRFNEVAGGARFRPASTSGVRSGAEMVAS